MRRASSAAFRQRLPQQSLPLKAVAVQSLFGAIIAVAVFVLTSRGAGISALSGVLVSILPSFYFAWRFMRVYASRQASESVGLMYRAEVGKFGLTVVMFIAVFVLLPPSHPAFFFFAYIATTLVQWLAPWLLRTLFRCRI